VPLHTKRAQTGSESFLTLRPKHWTGCEAGQRGGSESEPGGALFPQKQSRCLREAYHRRGRSRHVCYCVRERGRVRRVPRRRAPLTSGVGTRTVAGFEPLHMRDFPALCVSKDVRFIESTCSMERHPVASQRAQLHVEPPRVPGQLVFFSLGLAPSSSFNPLRGTHAAYAQAHCAGSTGRGNKYNGRHTFERLFVELQLCGRAATWNLL
jgi:hypothetical protein